MAIDIIARGIAAGKADLEGGKVPASQLPSYVDDVVEYDTASEFPDPGEVGKIYIDLSTGFTYRWGGTEYVKVGMSEVDEEMSLTSTNPVQNKVISEALTSYVPTAMIGFVQVDSVASGTLTEAQRSEIGKPFSFISRGYETFVRTDMNADTAIYKSLNIQAIAQVVNDSLPVNPGKITVTRQTGAWAYSAS